MIDTGDGISKALLNLNIKFNSINSILFTHYHSDHFSGIASLITQMKLRARSVPLTIYTYKNLYQPPIDFLNTSYLYKENLGFDLTIKKFELNTKQKISDSIDFTPKQNSHLIQKENLRHYPKNRFISLSLLLEAASKKIFYTSDIGSKEDLFLFAGEKLDYLITESTHVTLNEIQAAFKKLDADKLFITHIGDETENKLTGWHKSLSFEEQERIKICFDGMVVQI